MITLDTAPEQTTDSHALALRELRDAVGAAHVVVDEEQRHWQARTTDPRVVVPSLVVTPGTADEVQRVVAIANRHGLRLWPVSRGKNWGYGAASPAQEGTILLRLERLNRILEVKQELAYAVIEPGVTYRQLHEYLRDRGVPLWIDCTDGPPEGSVVGNALDRGVGHTPYGDHFGHLCGLEVVLPTGELARTGGGPPNLQTWNTYKWGTGPYLEGLFSQSNLGVVVKAGIWLMPKPQAFCSFAFDLARADDLPRVVDVVRRLALEGVFQSTSVIANDVAVTSALLGEHLRGVDSLARRRELTADLCREHGIAPWSLSGGVYGRSAQVREYCRILRRELSPFGSIQFVDDRKLRLLDRAARLLGGRFAWVARKLLGKSLDVARALPFMHGVHKGVPGEDILPLAYLRGPQASPAVNRDPARDGCGLLWFAPIVPLTSRHVSAVLTACEALYREHGFDFFASLHLHNARSVVVLLGIHFRKDDAVETRRAEALYAALAEATIAAGYQQYRTSVHGMDRVLDVAPESKRVANAIKRTLDPNNVLAVGRYGIDGAVPR